MDRQITGEMIKRLRTERKMTQSRLGEILHVSDKTISKWENGRGCPDHSLIGPLAEALGVSLIELFNGENVTNKNRSSNMLRMKFYVCPGCGNIIQSTGDAVVSCCGKLLSACVPKKEDEEHILTIERADDEYYVNITHEMTKKHYISFIAAVGDSGCDIRKLYPEGNAETYFSINGTAKIYYYCNLHGLFEADVRRARM